MGMVLDKDMLTVITEPVFVVPSGSYSDGTGFEGHEFFEASSIRKKGSLYYFIYSSVVMHELCYAVSDNPLSGFRYGGVIVSNCDIGIDSYKPAAKPAAFGANNHGSIVEIEGEWYIFYHRHTNNTWYSRQGCAEKLSFDGEKIIQAEMTSCGLNDGPLKGEGEYPSFIACNIFTNDEQMYVGGAGHPYIMQDGRDGDIEPAYITNLCDGSVIGFKYFDCKGLTAFGIKTRGYAHGNVKIKTTWDGDVLSSIPIDNANIWEYNETKITIPDGVHSIYLEYSGTGAADLKSFTFVC